jgi:pyruvate kinase
MTCELVADEAAGQRTRQRQRSRGRLAVELDELIAAAEQAAADRVADVAAVDETHRDDALNLVHYVAVRRHDLRYLQRRLAEHGLSSLGRSEPHVLATVIAVRDAIGRGGRHPAHVGFAAGRRALDVNTDALFGPRPTHRVPRIMVTLPTEAAVDGGLVVGFAERGMDVARINRAHDAPDAWRAMARNVRSAAAATGRRIPICFDLPGPKLRTGPIVPSPQALRLRPARDRRGIPMTPALVTLTDRPELTDGQSVPVGPGWLAGCGPGDIIRLDDTRGSPRTLHVVEATTGRVLAEVWDTTYVETGTVLHHADRSTTVGFLPPVEQDVVVRAGDRLRIVLTDGPVTPWCPGMPGPPTIGCSLPAAFEAVEVGERVLLDDGKFAGVIETVGCDEFTVDVTRAPAQGGRLRADKGINLPDTNLPIPMLGEGDAGLLEVAAKYGDMVGLSFLRHERDIDAVIDRLGVVAGGQLGMVCKIETIPAFRRLPEILLHAMRRPRVGVMIARGDLAVESSFERLAEVQEEILWVCEAAHVPVVWATQVLDQLARTGQPSRAEITDAAMAQRAECVMLNKGPHIDIAIETLDDILRRMAGHQRKKTALLRPLRAWDSAPDAMPGRV